METRTLLRRLKDQKKNRKTVTVSVHKQLQQKLQVKNETIRSLENEILILKEENEEFHSKDNSVKIKNDNKTYSSMTRMMVFDHIVNQVPTANIPIARI